jgi:hypothetical protein
MPFGFSGKFTFTRSIVFSSSSISITFATYGSSFAKSGLFVFAYRCAERDATHPEQRSLFCGSQRAGVPAGIAEVQTEIDSRKNEVNMLPMMRSERNAISWSPIHAIGLEVAQANPLIT